MNEQISLRLPEKLLTSGQQYAEKHGFSNVQEFIKELMREKLFEEPLLSEDELSAVKQLVELSDKEKRYGNEEQLFAALKR